MHSSRHGKQINESINFFELAKKLKVGQKIVIATYGESITLQRIAPERLKEPFAIIDDQLDFIEKTGRGYEAKSKRNN